MSEQAPAAYSQEIVDRFALLAEPRLASLLRLRSTRHVFDPMPGALHSRTVDNGAEFLLNRYKRASQPYRDIQRFLSTDKIMQYIIGPGLLPVVTALSKDILGRKVLITRRIAGRKDDQGVIAHLAGFGLRILMHDDEASGETIVDWECLYGVA